MYPTRPKVVKPEEATQREKDEQIVKQDVFKAAEILKTKDFNQTNFLTFHSIFFRMSNIQRVKLSKF